MSGRERIDLPVVTNSGSGSCAYADIGAYESSVVWYVDGKAEAGGNGSSWCGGEASYDGGGNGSGDPLFADVGRVKGPDGWFGTADDGLRVQGASACCG